MSEVFLECSVPQMVFDSFNTTMWASGAPSSNVRFRDAKENEGIRAINSEVTSILIFPLVRCWVVVRKFKEDGLASS